MMILAKNRTDWRTEDELHFIKKLGSFRNDKGIKSDRIDLLGKYIAFSKVRYNWEGLNYERCLNHALYHMEVELSKEGRTL